MTFSCQLATAILRNRVPSSFACGRYSSNLPLNGYEILIVFSRFGAVFARRNDGDRLLLNLLDQLVAVVSPISQHKIRFEAIDNGGGLRPLSGGSRTQPSSDGHPMCIDGPMYRRIEPPF